MGQGSVWKGPAPPGSRWNSCLIKLTHVLKINVCECPPLATATTGERERQLQPIFLNFAKAWRCNWLSYTRGALRPAIKWKLIYPCGLGPLPIRELQFFGQRLLGVRNYACDSDILRWFIWGETEMRSWWTRFPGMDGLNSVNRGKSMNYIGPIWVPWCPLGGTITLALVENAAKLWSILSQRLPVSS